MADQTNPRPAPRFAVGDRVVKKTGTRVGTVRSLYWAGAGPVSGLWYYCLEWAPDSTPIPYSEYDLEPAVAGLEAEITATETRLRRLREQLEAEKGRRGHPDENR